MISYEAPHLPGVRLGDGMFSVDALYRLSASENGTQLTYRADISLNDWFTKLIGILVRSLSMRILNRHMANLKQVAESDGQAEWSLTRYFKSGKTFSAMRVL